MNWRQLSKISGWMSVVAFLALIILQDHVPTIVHSVFAELTVLGMCLFFVSRGALAITEGELHGRRAVVRGTLARFLGWILVLVGALLGFAVIFGSFLK